MSYGIYQQFDKDKAGVVRRTWLWKIRTQAGLTQAEMADRLYMDAAKYAKLECTARSGKLPDELTLENAYLISVRFNVPFEKILELEVRTYGKGN